jgi:transcriptional regulator with XRE-family HTH domain
MAKQLTPGRRLRQWRVAEGLSLRDLAGRLGIATSCYCEFERDKTAPLGREAVVLKLCGVPEDIVMALLKQGDCPHIETHVTGMFVDWRDPETGQLMGGMQKRLTCKRCGKWMER